MINKYLTSERYLKNYNKGAKTVVVNLDNPEHIFVAEVDTYYHNASGWGAPAHRSNYLVGPVVETLHAYEELGYTPEELKKIIEEHKEYNAVDLAIKKLRLNMAYGTSAFANSSSRVMEGIREARRLAEERRYTDYDIYVTQRIADSQVTANKTLINLDQFKEIVDWVKEEKLKPAPSKPETKSNPAPVVDRAIFNDPATIVFWKDGTKTVVKAQKGETYDPEKGLAMAFSKKMFGNEGSYYDQFTKLLPKEKK